MSTTIKALGIRSPLLREGVLVETIDRGAYIPSRRLFSPIVMAVIVSVGVWSF
jgi:hypothetical protein